MHNKPAHLFFFMYYLNMSIDTKDYHYLFSITNYLKQRFFDEKPPKKIRCAGKPKTLLLFIK
ncbi:MAG: hypothetical protein A3E37_01005 [Candidatus Andersenbacteria bacterium RIFCSPHIGHO2_12_FULL_46_9]|nr:MAG: hypothetical protein A3B76_04145 [Candidatus Andersenbacteria bacterium RIFCSPHIGHO2_02_FULL_46_16]OGY37690.1 MAG: hypothetical protein A3E37_01005 [Candidatus Andersenbacteria bacterium RIFCSPHIGHO2_12_FULL_46_9]OGY38279.1 MAG: hypothetical protein A3I08_03335 [Candidatus Andersenbacteria bacterium RIFCSPLOWO2_02_FULL_46_11]